MITPSRPKALLLDTHAMLWLAEDNPRFGRNARAAVEVGVPTYLSVASVWEMAIKRSLGKMSSNEPIDVFVRKHVVGNEIQLINIDVHDCRAVELLPTLQHRDPFDRMIVAQAQVRDWTVATVDAEFAAYGVKTLW